jgi:hypothetical protein
MNKPQVLIATDSRALVLAEQLQRQLQKESCDVIVWSEQSETESSVMSIQMLEEAAGQLDFPVAVLSKGELAGRLVPDMQRGREICA